MPTFVAETTTNGNMNKILTIMAILLTSITGALAQTTKEVVEELNRSGFWMPYAWCLQNDQQMEQLLMSLNEYTSSGLMKTRELLDEDHQRAQALLKARQDICGKKKGKKALALLAKHFNDVDQAWQAFDNAEQTERRYQTVTKAIEQWLKNPVVRPMPAGRLLLFEFSTSNGFAGYRYDATLKRQTADAPATLLVNEQNYLRMGGHDAEPKNPKPVAVDDSVFVRVSSMIEQGKLHDVGRHYRPDVDITDASNWSMYIKFEKGTIDSDGYATGPDHSDTLHEVLHYLEAVYKKLTTDTADEPTADAGAPEKGDTQP